MTYERVKGEEVSFKLVHYREIDHSPGYFPLIYNTAGRWPWESCSYKGLNVHVMVLQSYFLSFQTYKQSSLKLNKLVSKRGLGKWSAREAYLIVIINCDRNHAFA